MMKTVSRYHPLLVALHWLLAVMITGSLLVGFFVLAATPNTDPAKLDLLELHMAGGMTILLLMAIRLAVRWRTAKPAAATIGNAFADRLAPVTHYGFYVLVFLMVVTGYTTGILAGLNRSVFARSGEPLPADFADYPTFVAHGLLAGILAGFVALHVFAALYHQYWLKDGLFRRIWFGGGRLDL
jgi:cytochrome b561